MKNTIIDLIRIPTDEYGTPLYSVEEVRDLFDYYRKTFPDHQVMVLPDKITFWENLDLGSLKSIRQCLDEIIASKETEENKI